MNFKPGDLVMLQHFPGCLREPLEENSSKKETIKFMETGIVISNNLIPSSEPSSRIVVFVNNKTFMFHPDYWARPFTLSFKGRMQNV